MVRVIGITLLALTVFDHVAYNGRYVDTVAFMISQILIHFR